MSAVVELAKRLHELAHTAAVNHGTSVDRFRVLKANPLIIEELEGELVLEQGDPDFTIGDLLRHFIHSNSLQPNDQVLVIRASGEWHAVDVVTSRTTWEP